MDWTRLTPPHDKVLHVLAGSLCSLAGLSLGVLARLLGADLSPLPVGLLACACAALGREAWNLRHGGFFDWRDVLATLAGAVPVGCAYAVGRGAVLCGGSL